MKIKIDKELFQWEKDRYITLELEKDDIQPSFVQFYNAKSPIGSEVDLIENLARIPNELLQVPLPIMAVVCHGEKGSARVIARREFKVLKRAKPENYQNDPSGDENYYIIYDGGEEV